MFRARAIRSSKASEGDTLYGISHLGKSGNARCTICRYTGLSAIAAYMLSYARRASSGLVRALSFSPKLVQGRDNMLG